MSLRRTAPLARRELLAALLLSVTAFGLWYWVFVVPGASFWLKIALAASVLAASSIAAMGPRRAALFRLSAADVGAGLVAAPLLYGAFIVGKAVLTAILPGTGASIGAVYAPRDGASLWVVGALLFFVTGPAEEVFWRGMLQRVLVDRLGPWGGLLLSSVFYALVHLCTLNVPLVLAALVAGLFFGALALWRGNLTAAVLCHSAWGVLIFVIFPVS